MLKWDGHEPCSEVKQIFLIIPMLTVYQGFQA